MHLLLEAVLTVGFIIFVCVTLYFLHKKKKI